MGMWEILDIFFSYSLKINFPLVAYHLQFEKHSSMHGRRDYWSERKEKTFWFD